MIFLTNKHENGGHSVLNVLLTAQKVNEAAS